MKKKPRRLKLTAHRTWHYINMQDDVEKTDDFIIGYFDTACIACLGFPKEEAIKQMRTLIKVSDKRFDRLFEQAKAEYAIRKSKGLP